MRKIDQKQKQRQSGGSTNGFIPNSFRSISSYLRIVSSGASTVASTVRSAASAASTIVDRDTDVVPDQVLWAGFDNLECEGDVTCRVLLLGYQYGFQVWDVEDANNVRNIVSRYDGAVFSMQILPKPVVSTHSRVEYVDDHPLLVICADGSFSAGGNAQGGPAMIKNTHDQVNGGSVPTVVWFYSLKSQSYIKELKFRSVVYSVRCSSRIVAVLQAAQVHCFDVATLQREYTILTNPIVTSSSRFDYMGLGPLAVGPRWVAYSGNVVALPNTRVTPQQLTHSRTFTTPGSNGSIVAHYAKQSSKQLAVGIVTLGDIGYKKLSRYYSEFLPDGSISQQVGDPSRKDRGTPNGRLPDTENVGMVIVRDVVSKSVIAQFKAHDSPIASLCFDPSGTLLVTTSVHGHNFNVFRIMPGLENGASYIHLYRLQRGFTNAVIRDISFSVDSRWITISSSRGTSHLFAISPSGGPVNIQSAEESLTTNQGYNYDATNKPPITLSAISRIRSGNSGWRNVVTGAAVAASGRMNTYSGVIVSTFHKCKDNNMGADLGSRKSKYHMLVFSSSGYVIQYALQVSSEVDTAYNSSPDHDSRLTVEPIQKWNICNKQNRREREENVDIYGENGHTVNRKVFPERTENVSIDYFDGMSEVKRDNVSLEERNHVYISEVELQMHQSQIQLWARAQINFHSLTIDDVTKDGGNYLKGEIEIEKIPTHTVEARSSFLVPAIDHFQRPRVQMTRVPALDYNGSESIPHQTFRLYEHEKLSNGSICEHEKLSNGSIFEHEKLSNGSPYEHEKLSNGSPYEHEKLYNGNIYDHEKLSTGSNYDHEKLLTGSSFNHDKLSNGSSFNHDKLSNGSSYKHEKLSNGSSYKHEKLSNGSSYEHEKLSNGSSYEHEKLTNGSSYEHEKLSNGSSYEHEMLSNESSLCPIYRTTDTIVSNGGFEIGDEETGEDARQMPVEDTDGFVNNDSNLISQTQPETVDNREHSVSDTQSELVNNNIGQKLENQFEDQGGEFD